MIRRSLTALVLAACTFAPAVSHAFPFPGRSDSAQTHGKMIKMTLRNRTAVPMDLLIEDKPLTIAANGEYALSAPEGTHIYGTDKVVKVMVTKDLNGTTCSFR